MSGLLDMRPEMTQLDDPVILKTLNYLQSYEKLAGFLTVCPVLHTLRLRHGSRLT